MQFLALQMEEGQQVLGPLEDGKDKDRFSPKVFRRNAAPLIHLRILISLTQNNKSVFKTLNLW